MIVSTPPIDDVFPRRFPGVETAWWRTLRHLVRSDTSDLLGSGVETDELLGLLLCAAASSVPPPIEGLFLTHNMSTRSRWRGPVIQVGLSDSIDPSSAAPSAVFAPARDEDVHRALSALTTRFVEDLRTGHTHAGGATTTLMIGLWAVTKVLLCCADPDVAPVLVADDPSPPPHNALPATIMRALAAAGATPTPETAWGRITHLVDALAAHLTAMNEHQYRATALGLYEHPMALMVAGPIALTNERVWSATDPERLHRWIPLLRRMIGPAEDPASKTVLVQALARLERWELTQSVDPAAVPTPARPRVM